MPSVQWDSPLDQLIFGVSMSYKYQATKEGPSLYVLPQSGEMRVPVKAFLSTALYTASEESVWAQAVNAASYAGVESVCLMPDTHQGFGVPIGCVLVTNDTLIQSASGYDISCGMLALRVSGVTAEQLKSKYNRQRWITEVEKRVALGLRWQRPPLMRTFSEKQIEDVLRHGAQAIGAKTGVCERALLPLEREIDFRKIEKAWSKAPPQLGTLGGGNHFIELQVDEADASVWVMVHTGSRGYGWQTAEHFFFEAARLRGIPTKRREDAWLRLDEDLAHEYWAYHNSAGNYASANRHVIATAITEALGEVFKASAEVYYEISHNLIQREHCRNEDGTFTQRLVHRKGATRALPAGHPDLVGTPWESTGHPCLTPGSMFEGAAILYPLAGAYETNCSVNHGSGRVLGRGEAKRRLEHKQAKIDEQMNTVQRTFQDVVIEGIVGNSEHTPLDECGDVYKDLDEVLETLKDAGVARVEHRLYPVAYLKGLE